MIQSNVDDRMAGVLEQRNFKNHKKIIYRFITHHVCVRVKMELQNDFLQQFMEQQVLVNQLSSFS